MLERVLQGGVSARSASNNQGQGLKTLSDIVRNHQGTLLVVSGGAEAHSTGASDWSMIAGPTERPFPGTAVFFTLPLNRVV